jgi:pimeloyl-ACP methyl ester carboxylesterase
MGGEWAANGPRMGGECGENPLLTQGIESEGANQARRAVARRRAKRRLLVHAPEAAEVIRPQQTRLLRLRNFGRHLQPFAAELAARGFVTISVDVGRHKVREKGHLLMGERLRDLFRCVDYLIENQSVDNARIGCAGLSLGGEMCMWLAALDPRVRATVSSGFLTTMDQMEKNHCMCWKFAGLRELVDYADIYSLTSPRALQCQNGLREGPRDFYVPFARRAMQQIRVIYQDQGVPERVELDVHDAGHVIDLPALLEFLTLHLR